MLTVTRRAFALCHSWFSAPNITFQWTIPLLHIHIKADLHYNQSSFSFTTLDAVLICYRISLCHLDTHANNAENNYAEMQSDAMLNYISIDLIHAIQSKHIPSRGYFVYFPVKRRCTCHEKAV